MPNAIRIYEQEVQKSCAGNPLTTELGSEEIRIRHTAIGLNFIDTYHEAVSILSTHPVD